MQIIKYNLINYAYICMLTYMLMRADIETIFHIHSDAPFMVMQHIGYILNNFKA